MKKQISQYIEIFILLLITSCAKPDINLEDTSVNDADTINIPEGFDYSTHKTVSIKIYDDTKSIYEVFVTSEDSCFVGTQTYVDESGKTVTKNVYRDDIINKQVLKGVTKNGILEQSVTLPKYCRQVYIRRNDNLKYSGELVDVINNEVQYRYQKTTSKSLFSKGKNGVVDFLFCVNGSGDLFVIDPLDGSYTYLSEMPMGSWTCAIDQENKFLYSIGKSQPYPLMKYSIDNDTWEIIANLGIGGPRLDYNKNDGLLYFSNNNLLYTFHPTTGEKLNTWDINGLHNPNGGDLAFAEDGSLFLCTFSGLYKLSLNANNQYDSTRISADNLPFNPTSMTFDSNKELWLANNKSSSDLIIMDTVTGGWQYVYGVQAANNTDFGRTINDLTTFRIYSDTPDTKDTDGDGIVDSQDAFPEEANKAFEMFTPSKYGTGTIAFEDLWPYQGDYDFNDMALNYKTIAILNSNNLAVQIDLICKVKSNFAGYSNGIGIEIEGLQSDEIENVTGAIYTENYIQLNPNGTEANQDRAVIILTDNADNLVDETTISIILKEPTTTEAIGTAHLILL
ncbi:LruC domain-containing protein [Jejuia pallidilutea]|uniref:DUF4842 domain-containing protein n=1 Tax=Jejuia pallidilutea TaxID=504487 RepID=A0A090W3G7_9FLAO|nr:LruC domain-containing protein [Jejuia pallidilutea]GAL71545.1 hypothetical protein JCM19302_1714 [Jejuia pallidilutea]